MPHPAPIPISARLEARSVSMAPASSSTGGSGAQNGIQNTGPYQYGGETYQYKTCNNNGCAYWNSPTDAVYTTHGQAYNATGSPLNQQAQTGNTSAASAQNLTAPMPPQPANAETMQEISQLSSLVQKLASAPGSLGSLVVGPAANAAEPESEESMPVTAEKQDTAGPQPNPDQSDQLSSAGSSTGGPASANYDPSSQTSPSNNSTSPSNSTAPTSQAHLPEDPSTSNDNSGAATPPNPSAPASSTDPSSPSDTSEPVQSSASAQSQEASLSMFPTAKIVGLNGAVETSSPVLTVHDGSMIVNKDRSVDTISNESGSWYATNSVTQAKEPVQFFGYTNSNLDQQGFTMCKGSCKPTPDGSGFGVTPADNKFLPNQGFPQIGQKPYTPPATP
jgi:hypothetical protein